MITISVESAAIQLAEAIKETEEYVNLNSVHARIQLDPVAQNLISDMEQKQLGIQQAHSQGQPVHEEIEELHLIQQRAMNNPTLKQLFEAQEAFGKIMEEANQVINRELSS